jgi:hypothetical protein
VLALAVIATGARDGRIVALLARQRGLVVAVATPERVQLLRRGVLTVLRRSHEAGGLAAAVLLPRLSAVLPRDLVAHHRELSLCKQGNAS